MSIASGRVSNSATGAIDDVVVEFNKKMHLFLWMSLEAASNSATVSIDDVLSFNKTDATRCLGANRFQERFQLGYGVDGRMTFLDTTTKMFCGLFSISESF